MARAPMAWREMVIKVEEARRLILTVVAMKIPTKARVALLEAAEMLNETAHRAGGD